MNANKTERTLFTDSQIARRVEEVAREIAARSTHPEVAVPILAGAFVFAADLLRALAREGLHLETEFIWLQSYGRLHRPGELQVLKGPGEAVNGRTVLLIDGVLDHGTTIARAKALLDEAGAVEVISAVAVVKSATQAKFTADYTLFTAGAEFLYGYGMDSAGHGRGLPEIRVRNFPLS
jgi:hypoxanthine phosphoribosyltransferase